MKKQHVASLGLPNGFPVAQYENLKEITDAVNGDETKVVDIVNKYLRQKGPLVDGRDMLSEHVAEKLGFSVKTRTVTKEGDNGEKVESQVPDETEGKHLDRFVAAVVSGTATVPGIHFKETDNEEQKEAHVWSFLQKVADKFDLRVDAKTPERVSRPKKYENLPKYARDGAENIIKNGTQAKWKKTFEKEGIPFEDFTVADDPDGNKLRLALAIKEREDRQEKPSYS